MAKEKVPSSGMLDPKALYTGTISELKVEDWDKGQYAVKGKVRIEGFVEKTNLEPWAEWMGKEMFFSIYMPDSSEKWYGMSLKKMEGLARALKTTSADIQSSADSFVNTAVCVGVDITGGKFRVVDGRSEWQPLREEVGYFEPIDVADLAGQ